MAIVYSTTYEIIDDESAEHGEAKESGFLDENLISGFRDMVETLQGTEPSSSDIGSARWFTRHGDMDMYSGEYENVSYHPATRRAARYMRKAWAIGNNAR